MAEAVSPILRLPRVDVDFVINGVGSRWERMRGKRLLLTGGTGFIGKWLLGTFLHANRRFNLGAQVVAVSRRPDSFLHDFPELRSFAEIEWIQGDVRSLDRKIATGCNYAIHGATDVAVTKGPAEILETCIVGTTNVLNAMANSSSKSRLLLLSSGAVYGRSHPNLVNVSESWLVGPDPLFPASAYGEGKRVSELLCAIAAANNASLEVSIARCFAFVGPHLPFDKHFAIGNFVNSAMRGEDILIQGDGTPLRSYLYASDLVYWLWVMLFDAPNARAYNVGASESLSIVKLAHRVNSVLNGTGKVTVAQAPAPNKPPEAYVPSIERIASELGLKPTVKLEDAILRTARWAGFSLEDK